MLVKNEVWRTTEPEPEQCMHCAYALDEVIINGKTIDRSGYSMCKKYKIKPQKILWNKAKCPLFEKI